jgi:hypothetical protein
VATLPPQQTAQGDRTLQKFNWIKPKWFRLIIQLFLNYSHQDEEYRIERKFANPEGSKYIK